MQKRNRRILAAALALVAQGTLAQGNLPLCPGTHSASAWTNCRGEQTFPSGRKYVGEFKFNGQSTYTFPDGGRYTGALKDGKPRGQGVQHGADGKELMSGSWDNGAFMGKR